MIRNFSLILLLFAAVFLFNTSAPAQAARGTTAATELSAEEISAAGTINDGVYKNRLIGFSVSLPKDSQVASEAVNKAGLSASRDVAIQGKAQQEKEALNRSIARTAILFNATGTGNFIAGVETVPNPAMELDKYIAQNQDLILSMNPGSKIAKNTYIKNVGGADFKVFETEIPKGDLVIRQTYMVMIRKNVMFFFVLTYRDAETRKELEDTVNTLKLDK